MHLVGRRGRSVTCVSLSLPESANRWDRWKEPPTGTGSNRWRDPAVPVLVAGLVQPTGRSEPTQRSSPYTVAMTNKQSYKHIDLSIN